jgi:integrase
MKRHQNYGLRKVCGCARRTWPKCPHSWHLNYKPRGRKAWRLSLDREVGKHVDSKSDAIAEANKIRAAIDAGTFRMAASSMPTAGLTLRDVAKKYKARHVNVPTRREHAGYSMELHVDRLCAATVPATDGAVVALGDKPITTIIKADIEVLRDQLRAEYQTNRDLLVAWEAYQALPDDEREKTVAPPRPPRTMRAGAKQGETGINRLLARARHLFSWAIVEGYTTETPFRRHGVTIIRLEMKAETARTRRLEPGEEDALRSAAQPHLRALIIAALSTGCRLGELLSLQWKQIRHDDQAQPRWIVLAAADTKTNRSRTIPIGPRLRAELEMRRTDAAGEVFGGDAFVFGNEIGERVASIKTAWRATCRRAGVRGLHFHDLRREFGSRLLESGADPHDVREFLGHANITTTSRYLASTPLRLERALSRMEAAAAGTLTDQADAGIGCKTVANGADQAEAETAAPHRVN